MSLIRIKNYIGGELVEPVNHKWLENFEPATGHGYSLVPDSGAEDVDAAVQAARKAWPAWAGLTVDERAAALFSLADAIDDCRDELVSLESQDNGKPEWLARQVDIPRCSKNLRHFAATVIGNASQSHAMNAGLNYTLRKPLGVVGIISPWNLPLYLFTWKIAPALATGNCVIGKPSEVTPMTAYRLAQICQQAGFPAGVLNIVHGSGTLTGNALLNHRDIKAISFTGGTKTGRHVAAVCATQLKKFSLELGGKNPNVIFADCDYEKTLDTTLRSSFDNQGQICLCGSRIYVESKLYNRFKLDFVERARALVVGDPKDANSKLGAVVSQPHFEKILRCIDDARHDGGKVLTGGESVRVGGRCQEGWFVAPTVIEGLATSCSANQEEIFGPVVTIQPFDSEAEAIDLANATQYGLSSTVWTQDIGRAHRVAEAIEAGVVWINCWMIRDLRTPFGGVKQSGMGREGGEDSLQFFTQSKNVCLKF
jgi:aminomuconate-semialdehyde/2-hydroxymuconate-6-semialdehyde dehydrogenase